jgi:hypothetical protein
MSNRIPSKPRHQSQSETDTDTETSSRVSSPSSSGQSSASEDGSEKSVQTPVMKTRQPSDEASTTPATHNPNSSAPPQAAMTSSPPSVKNRQTSEEKRELYRDARNLSTYHRYTDINKIKTTKQSGAAAIQHAPEHNAVFEKYSSAVRDGKLYSNSVRLKNFMGDLAAWLRTSPDYLRELFLLVFEENSGEFALLAEALGGNTTLIKLEVIGYLGEVGAAAIADALRVNTTLTELNLRGNDVGEEGAKALADALKVNTTLTELDISCDYMGDEGAKALADALKINKTVTKLILFAYNITEEGEKALLEALRVNETLTSLSFSCTEGGMDIQARDLLERNKQLKRLKLMPYAQASLDLLVRHSPALKDMNFPTDVLPLLAEQLSNEALVVFEQEWKDAFRAPPPPVITTTTNATVTTTTTTTTDATIPTTLVTSPAATATSPASVPPLSTQPTATAAEINALLADPNPVVALSRWIDGHANPAAALNWVDPSNGYTLLHYAVAAQQGGVVRSLLARGIDRTRADQTNQTAAQLAQQRAESSSSSAVAAIAALFK